MLSKPDSLKSLSAALSERLSAVVDLQEAKQIFEENRNRFQGPVHTVRDQGKNATTHTTKHPETSRILIWEPRYEDGEVWFVRPADSDLLRMCADVERIGPKRNRLRVVLLGESVARGFLLDPYFNVATALETLLNSSGVGPDVEVVDLARNGLTFSGLENLLEPSLALKPDAYVIFAGNNWNVPQPELMKLGKIAALLQETRQWKPVSVYVEEIVRNQVRAFVERLGKFSAQNQIPVVFLIPEFNLGDWRLEDRPSPLVTGDLMRRRLELIHRAEDALAKDKVRQAAVLADQLIELEDGSHSAGFEILAKCELRYGNFDRARRLKRTARDLALTYSHVQTPICYSFIQEALREHGPTHGITIVDLPQRFAEYLPQSLPDRRLFLDYVHLTLEGIRLAAASAVEKLLPLLGKEGRSWSELNKFEFQVEPRGMALSHFGGACASVSYGQDNEFTGFHCSEALRHDPKITEVMDAFLNWHIRVNRSSYVRKFEDVLGRKGQYLLKFPRRPFRQFLDGALHPALIQAFTSALACSVPEAETGIDRLLKRELGVTRAGIDLLQGVSMELADAPLEALWRDENCYFKSFHQKSYFYVVCELPSALQIRLVCRVFNAESATRSVELFVNGVSATNFTASTNWHTWQGTIPADLLHSGINSVVLSWPEIEQTKTERVAEVIKNLESAMVWGDLKDIYSGYGEIHEFRAATV